MRLTKDWLQSWVSVPDDMAKLMCQHSVETLVETNPAMIDKKVVIGRVLTVFPHPDSEKLQVTTVTIGQDDTLEIVCGCPSVKPDMIVPVATIGSKLPGGKIKKSKLRGVVSQGMLCSLQDLGLAAISDGLFAVESSAPIGEPFADYIKQSDKLFDFEITPNRGDCFSALGIAREVAAITQTKMPQATQARQIDRVEMSLDKHCPVFAKAVVGEITPKPLPVYMTARLQAAGISSVHPVVDILNYVMLDIGQPMHAYDSKKLSGELRVIRQEKGDTLSALNDDEITIQTGDLVVADDKQVQALAGIIGAKASKVEVDTTEVVLEAAHFDMDLVRTTANRLNLHTDSSIRFARHVDANLPPMAVQMAADLICQHLSGKWNGAVELCGQSSQPHIVEISASTVNKKLGTKLSCDECCSYLDRLGIQTQCAGEVMTASVPSHRAADLREPHDLIEEIIRLHGYDNLEPSPLSISAKVDLPEFFLQQGRLRSHLIAQGFTECVSYAFVSERMNQMFASVPEKQVEISNPVSSEFQFMRQNMLASLLSVAQKNYAYEPTRLKLFEIGQTYFVDHEQPTLAVVMLAEKGSPLDAMTDLMASLSRALRLSGSGFELQAASHPGFHPGICADVLLDGAHLGQVGQLHPKLASQMRFTHDVYLAEIKLTLSSSSIECISFSKQPRIVRDFAYNVDKDINFAQIRQLLVEQKVKHLHDIQVFDIYQLDGAETISLGIRYVFSHKERSLTDEEVNRATAKINQCLDDVLSINVR